MRAALVLGAAACFACSPADKPEPAARARLATSSSCGPAYTLADFQKCVSSAGTTPVCSLDPNVDASGAVVPWLVTSTIAVERPVTIQGNAVADALPTLARDRSRGGDGAEHILQISASSVTVRDLRFQGGYGSTAAPPTSCDPCAGTCGLWADLWIDGWASNVTLTGLDFKDASENAIVFQGDGGVIDGVHIDNGRNCGIHLGNATRTRVVHSVFENNLGAGVCIAGGVNADITIGSTDGSAPNRFFHNHYGKPDCSSGGELYIGGGTRIVATNNVIDGGDAPSSHPENIGVEVDPGSYDVLLSGNEVMHHGHDGFSFQWSTGVTVEGGSVHDNNGHAVVVNGQNNRWCTTRCAVDPVLKLRGTSFANNAGGEDFWLWGVLTDRSICTTFAATARYDDGSVGDALFQNADFTCPGTTSLGDIGPVLGVCPTAPATCP